MTALFPRNGFLLGKARIRENWVQEVDMTADRKQGYGVRERLLDDVYDQYEVVHVIATFKDKHSMSPYSTAVHTARGILSWKKNQMQHKITM